MIVVGNGESRKDTNLTNLKNIVGCNALHRDLAVDHLVCVDRRCVLEALTSPNCTNTKIYTRSEWIDHFNHPALMTVPELPYRGELRQDDPFQWGSGGYALVLAAQLSDRIDIIGFDLWGSGKHVNNIYKDTKNYNAATSHSVDPSYWIYQVGKVFACYPDKYFTVYNVEGWQMPNSWCLANVNFKTVDTLQSQLYTSYSAVVFHEHSSHFKYSACCHLLDH